MRLLVGCFDHSRSAHAARRRLLATWPSAVVELGRCPEGTRLQVMVDDEDDGRVLYLLHRCGATLEADLAVDDPLGRVDTGGW